MLKKIWFLIFPAIALAGCVGVGPAQAVRPESGSSTPASGSSRALALDTAIEQAAGRMEQAFNAGTVIALISVSSPSAQFSDYVLTYLEAVLVNNGKLTVVDRANLDKIRAEQGFQLSGDVSDESAKRIGQMLGAGAIVTGTLVNLGDAYRLTLKAINVETARVAASHPADIANSTRVQILLAGEGGGTQPAGRPGGSTAAILPGPADGTYTFYPRVQAFQGARSVAVYLDRIVVRRGYMTIYIFNTPEGSGSGYGSSLQGQWRTATLTDMDNNRTARLIDVVGKGPPYGDVCEYNLNFQNVSGTRFTLASSDRPAIEFYDFFLEEPDY